MTFPVTFTLRGCCKVINWPSFNIAVSQEIGKPEERKMGKGWLVGQSESMFINKFCHHVCIVYSTPKQ